MSNTRQLLEAESFTCDIYTEVQSMSGHISTEFKVYVIVL